MTWQLLALSDMWELPVSDQLISYADAYRASSATLCQKMLDDPPRCTWPNAAVVLMLAAHAVELFLKGALYKRKPDFKAWDHGHNLDSLGAAYRSQFQDSRYDWEIPFTSQLSPEEWIAEMMKVAPQFTEEELRAHRGSSRIPPPSILHRYPVDRTGNDWKGLHGFEPGSFMLLLAQLERDFNRIKAHIDS